MSFSNPQSDLVDVLIVGRGSPGSVLAARLSEDPHRTVRPPEAANIYPLNSIPPDLLDPAHVPGEPEHDWGYTMRANAHNPEVPAPRGKALGGSSSVNATVAMRATRDDIRKWNMVLELRTPHGTTWAALRQDLPVLLACVLSFVDIGIYWNNPDAGHGVPRPRHAAVGQPAPAVLAVAHPGRHGRDE